VREFVEEDGCMVEWRPYEFLGELSFLITFSPVPIMLWILIWRGMATVEGVLEFLKNQNQFKIFFAFCLLILLLFRLFFYKGARVVFDPRANELRRTFEFRLGLRWVDRWPISDIVSIASEPIHADRPGNWGWQVVVRFAKRAPYVLGASSDQATCLRAADCLTTFLSREGVGRTGH
jgi:hypothetical protein